MGTSFKKGFEAFVPENCSHELIEDNMIILSENSPDQGAIRLVEESINKGSGSAFMSTKSGLLRGNVDTLKVILDSPKDYLDDLQVVILEKVQSEMTDEDLGYNAKIDPVTMEKLAVGDDIIQRKTITSWIELNEKSVLVQYTHRIATKASKAKAKEAAKEEAKNEFVEK